MKRLNLRRCCCSPPPPRPLAAQVADAAAVAAPGDGPEDAKLKALFHASDEANLKRNPVAALFRGDLRYADQLGDFLTDAKTAADKQALLDDLAGLKRIDRAKLTPVDQIAYDVFKNEKQTALKGLCARTSSGSTARCRSIISPASRPSIPISRRGRGRRRSRRSRITRTI